MDQSLHDEITRLLAQIDAQQSQEYRGEEEIIIPVGSDAPRLRRIINVYIDVEEEDTRGERKNQPEEPRMVESTLNPVIEPKEPRKTPTGSTGEAEQAFQQKPTSHERHPRPLLILFVALSLIVTVASITLYLLPSLTSSATITIIPVSKQVTTTSTVQVVTGTANTAAHQIAGRVISSVSMSQAQTVPTTGITHQDARAGRGRITFYNAAPYMQTVPAGSLITGADGVQVVTEQDAVLPAVSYPTLGQATVLAHAAMTGPGGNIRASDIYGSCCRLNVSAVSSAFHGGHVAQTYQTVSQQDMNGVVSNLKKSLHKSMQSALQAQIRDGETLINPFPCKTQITADHQVGDEAQQLQVTMSETCTGEAYSTQAYHDVAMQIVSETATKRLGEGYTLMGDIQATPNTTTTNEHGVIDLATTIAGTWAYQFTEDQVQSLKAMIAGKSEAQAKAMIFTSHGVQGASMTLRNGMTLPTDISSIHVVVLVVGS
jgi:hypothetical protein